MSNMLVGLGLAALVLVAAYFLLPPWLIKGPFH
jgi:hypothetical protein